MRYTTISLFVLLLLSCEPSLPSHAQDSIIGEPRQAKPTTKLVKLNQDSNTLSARFAPPEGAKRVKMDTSSFAAYLRNLPLKPHGAKVHYFDGREKRNTYVHAAVIDMDVGDRDLQQCADAIIRLRAEYLFQRKTYSEIHFNFTNGFKADYQKWRAGQRIKVDGNSVSWIPGSKEDGSYKSFRSYLNMVFAYAGTQSMEKELKPVELDSIEIGDIFIQGGSPGHAIIVVDMAIDEETEERFFLLAQSYMPAQEMHILNNPQNKALSPWYSNKLQGRLVTPEWMFDKGDLKRF